ncbi:MAG: type I glyceraldehyde-3-phosphate dehydrogenase [Acidobacteria bacterium]|nr:MAG: type I glyceraldehyde-3-phosphate dehydrogenase [Acidobacteriota bacterium]
MAKVRVGINGFGRIGRCTFKQLAARGDVEIAGVNDLADPDDLAYLLKYDSVHGWYKSKVWHDNGVLHVDERSVPILAHRDPRSIPWGDLGAQVVIEATGVFRRRAAAAGHLEAGARYVVISAPSDDADGTFVLGVNDDRLDPARHRVLSMASCTTNCVAPPLAVLDEAFGVEEAMFTTVHAYTASQSLMDRPIRKRRRGRAAALSIVPTTTGAARAVERVLPQLEGKIDGMAMRVPVPDGSVTDLVVRLRSPATVEAVHDHLEEAARGPRLEGILRVTREELVSRDIVGDPHSSIVDATSTRLLNGRLLKLVVWYDNEWGYSARLVDLAVRLGAFAA